MYCRKCGAEIKPGAKYCPRCGEPVPQAPSGPVPQAPSGGGGDEDRQGPSASLFIGLIAGAVGVVVGLGVWIWIAFLAPYPIDESTFPDTAVRTVLAGTVDSDGNGEVSRDEAAAVTSFTVDGAASIEGLDRLPNIRQLSVGGSALSSVDLGPFGALEGFSAPDSSLVSIDVSRNPNLDVLDVPESTQVTGVEATKLVETWLPTSLESSYRDTETGEFVVNTRNEIERDPHGNQTKRIVQKLSDGFVSSTFTTEYAYDDAGRISTSTQSYQSNTSSDGSVDTSTYSYDESGRLVSITSDTGSSGNEEAYAYDDAGRLSTITYTYDGSSESHVITIEYDDEGRPTAAKSGGNGLSATWAYDDQGRLSMCGDFYSDARVLTDHALTYDEQGRVTKVRCTPGPPINPDFETYSPDFETSVTYTYDENGHITSGESQTTSAEGSSEGIRATCELDDEGRLSSVVYSMTYNNKGQTNTYEYREARTLARYFIPEDDEEDKTYIYLIPTYDNILYGVYIKEPDIPIVPDLEPSLTAFEYGMYRDYLS